MTALHIVSEKESENKNESKKNRQSKSWSAVIQ